MWSRGGTRAAVNRPQANHRGRGLTESEPVAARVGGYGWDRGRRGSGFDGFQVVGDGEIVVRDGGSRGGVGRPARRSSKSRLPEEVLADEVKGGQPFERH
ncbi:hypothetical protein HPP92_014913 [Vanilla planifolia]|uniref:Uncharacterized protein n=1 Tax=Vanilla planifolia TaxID=51239 RepID=A0A835QLB4_VANPL|nr:hypothetical protein HPP92_014913 [Vanilla planifolia]